MELPASPKRCLAIAMLRAVGIIQKDTARYTRCANQTVVDVEKWLREQDYHSVARICDDQSIKKMVATEAIYWGLEEEVLVRLDRLTQDDILRHYRTDYIKQRGSKDTNLVSQKRLATHYQRLCKLVEEFSNRLRIPELPRLHLLTLESGTPIPHSLSDMFGPVIMTYGDNEAVRLDVEGEFLWDYLKEHLIAEFPEFSENLGDWKKGIAIIAKRCHDIIKTIADGLAEKRWDAAEFGLSQDSKDYGPGVYCNLLTVSIYQCVVDNYLPQFRRTRDSRGLLLLDMEGPWGQRSVVRGGSPLLDQVEQFCHDMVGDEAIKKKVRQTLSLVKNNLEPLQESIKRKLQLVLERGTFKGSCQICSDLAS